MITVYYCTDNKLFKQLLLSIISLANHTKEPVQVFNLTLELLDVFPKGRKTSAEQDALLDKIMKESNPDSSFKSIDVSPLVRKHLLHGANINNKFYNSAYVSVRLLAHMVDEIAAHDNVLYLDSDTIFNGDVKTFWDEIDLTGVEIAGRRDLYRITRYMQSGVMFLNMKLIRETGMFDRALELVANKKFYCYIDMGAMNIACKKRKLIKHKFNCYDYDPRCIVHHVTTMREGHIPFTKKWWHRIKTDEPELMRKKIPQYNWLYNTMDLLERKHPECFKK